ncbi:MAG: histidine kinase [Terrimonas ferruginea]|jgi:two-component system LytT family sensor kinase|uniref:sensor histidine kinase n=1 Tax=Terrimonas ferruginea TaxID=249 RepID=UPI000416F608|nr:histidine kinase [Terrimonas ferruginea]MBN8784749.1 histidine kinase [Terrimonas ferruginea]
MSLFSNRYRYLFIVALSLYTYLCTVLCEVYKYFDIRIEWYYAAGSILLTTWLTWEGNRWLEPFWRRKFNTDKQRAGYFISFFFTGGLLAMFVSTLVVIVNGMVIHQYSWHQNRNPLKLMAIYASLLVLLYHLLNAVYIFFSDYRRKWQEAEELRQANTQIQLQLFRNQVNPHFLFNNLNVLSAMVIRDNPDANRFIESFSSVYRYILHNRDREAVQLSEELGFIKPYLYLLQKRFGEGLQVTIDIAESCHNQYIVPASLQLVIENAVKHNIVSPARPLLIAVVADGNDTIRVMNNFQPRTPDADSTGIGLQNIRQSYRYLSAREVEVVQTEERFEVVLPLLTIDKS